MSVTERQELAWGIIIAMMIYYVGGHRQREQQIKEFPDEVERRLRDGEM